MITRFTATFFFTLFINCSYAVDSTFNWLAWKQTWPKQKLDLNAIILIKNNNFTQAVRVMDMRSDTTNFGLLKSKSHQPIAIVSDILMEHWINKKMSDNPSGYSFVFVVKNLWLKDSFISVYRNTKQPEEKEHKSDGRHKRTEWMPVVELISTIDVFIRKDVYYYPLVRLDTILQKSSDISKPAEQLISEMLSLLNTKMHNSISLNRFQNRKEATPELIVDNYSKIFQIPIMEDRGVNKGVYLNWDQFKNNRPDTSIRYLIKKNRSGPPLIYTKNTDGLEVLLQDAFAICDDKFLYKIDRGNVYNMYKDYKSFYWMGFGGNNVKSPWIPIIVPLPGAVAIGTQSLGVSFSEWVFPHLLNMETGVGY